MSLMTPGLLLVATVAVPLALLLACAFAPLRRVMPALAVLAPLPGLAAALTAAGSPPIVFGPPRLRLALALDLPGAVLLGVSALLWVAASRHALSSMRGTRAASRFVTCWIAALAGCLGAIVAADMVSLYGMLGLMTIGATGLVIHDETPRAWRAGAVYFGMAIAGESVLLAGLVMAAAATPGESLLIRDAAAALAVSPQRDLALACIVGGLGLKAAIVPLHVWMPLAYPAAPIPAASVMSGALVKVSILGLIRFLPLGTVSPDWGQLLVTLGFIGAFYGVALGLTQRDPKAVLAYSSVSQMGVIVAVLGMGLATGDAATGTGAAFYAAHHVLVKGAMFLAVGVIACGAVGRHRVVLWPAAVLCLSLGGLPLTGGALAKYAVKDQLDVGLIGWLAAASAVGTTWLMLHFLRRLATSTADRGRSEPSLAPAWPWLATALAGMLVPWLIMADVGLGPAAATLAPKALWAAVWPVALGAVLAYVTRDAAARWPAVREGDLVVLLDAAGRGLVAAGARLQRADAALRQWTVAALLLLAIVIAVGASMILH